MPYYPDQARYAHLAAEALGLRFVDLDDGCGYAFAVEGATGCVVSGAGWVCSYPVNSASSFMLSRDKAHTKSVLRHFGVPVIPGSLFFNTTEHVALRNAGREAQDALPFALELGFPVFCKPNKGARGDYAELVTDAAALADYQARLPASYESFLVEKIVDGDEYRVLVYGGEALYVARKTSPQMIGDGKSDLSMLLGAMNASLAGTGISPHPIAVLAASGFAPDYIPAPGECVAIAGRRNLSAMGGIDYLSTDIPEPLHRIARSSCAALGLTLGAVDIFDISPGRNLADLVVIEVNGNPALKALEQIGRMDIIVDIWVRMIRQILGI